MKKYVPDLIVILSIVAISFAVYFFIMISSSPDSYDDGLKKVTISVNGNPFGEYMLEEEKNIVVDSEFGHSLICIHDGRVFFKEADCPDKLCVLNQGIMNSGEQIICLPNRVVVNIENIGGEGEFDAIAY